MAKPYKYPLVNGKRIHFRKLQMTLWGVILGLLAAGFFAGLYWLVFQQRYGGTSAHPVSLKNWWDSGMGFIHSPSWSNYRHSLRNQMESAGATVLILSFLFGVTASGKTAKIHRWWTLVTLGITLAAVIVAGALTETYLLYTGFPLWMNHSHPLAKLPEIACSLVLGFILGKVLHIIWKPAAATIQYHLLEGPVSRGKTPLWVRLALAPPTLRERFADLQQKLKDKKITVRDIEEKDHSGWFRVSISLGILLFFVIAILGNLAKYAIARGVNIPGMHS